jgi:hypothetical protein
VGKLIFSIFLILPFCFPANSQESGDTIEDGFPNEAQPSGRQPITSSIFGISSLVWNDDLKIQDGITISRDSANYLGTAFSYQSEKKFSDWGWSAGFFFASGKAVGGGNSSLIDYKKNKIAFFLFGFYPRIFYRLSGRVHAGVSVRVFYRNVDWPRDTTTQTVDGGRNLNLVTLADVNLRLTPKWDLNTAIGPFNDGATLWQIGAFYRF